MEITVTKHIRTYKDLPIIWKENRRIDFYRTQIVKYMWRLRDKGDPLKDAQKAKFYLGRLIQKLS